MGANKVVVVGFDVVRRRGRAASSSAAAATVAVAIGREGQAVQNPGHGTQNSAEGHRPHQHADPHLDVEAVNLRRTRTTHNDAGLTKHQERLHIISRQPCSPLS